MADLTGGTRGEQMTPPPLGSTLTLPVPRLGSERARREAEQELLAASQAARRALDMLTAYERRHGEEPLGLNRLPASNPGTSR
jgi:hypothetical protein